MSLTPGAGQSPYQIVAYGRELLLLDVSELPARIHRVDLRSGRRDVWRELEPADRVGVSGVGRAVITPDGSAYAYSYQQFRSDLYVARGLR